jgi:hypothetical protein
VKFRRTAQVFGIVLALLSAVAEAAPTVTVYKSSTCGCCGKWIEYLRTNGFAVNAVDVPDISEYKQRLGVPLELGSCHTAVVDGYLIEGHVPVREIKRLLAERPKAKGLAVPSMPPGSPGMEGPRSIPYDVLLFQADGKYTVYQKYGK